MDDVVRCPGCGAVASAWAATCPRCDEDRASAEAVAQVAAPVSPTDGSRTDGPAAKPGPSYRTRYRRFAAAAAVAIGVASWAGIARSASTPRWPAALQGRTVVEVHGGRLLSFSARDLAGTPLGFFDRAPRFAGGPIQVSGDAVAVVDGMAYAFDPHEMVRLGLADSVIANVGDTAVWLVRGRAGSPQTVSLMAVTGDQEEATTRLPAGTTVVADAGPGLLVRRGSQPPMLWVPRTGRIAYRFPATFGDLVATGDPYEPHVAWRDDRCEGDQCGLHLTDITTFVDQLLRPPAGYAGFLPGGGFSPDDSPIAYDDTVLAAIVADPRHPGSGRVDLMPTPDPPQAQLSDDLPLPRDPAQGPTVLWAPPGAPESLFIDDGSHAMKALHSDAVITTIPVPPSSQFAVL
jgi:hypothetical protein